MSNRLVWDGLDELRANLRALPDELTAEATAIVTGAVEVAKADVIAAYEAHRVTGHLAQGVTIGRGVKVGRFGAGTVLKSNAPHAWLVENGSQARHYMTVHGVEHLTGAMPAFHIFIPIVSRRRYAMYTALADMMRGHGLRCFGTFGVAA